MLWLCLTNRLPEFGILELPRTEEKASKSFARTVYSSGQKWSTNLYQLKQHKSKTPLSATVHSCCFVFIYTFRFVALSALIWINRWPVWLFCSLSRDATRDTVSTKKNEGKINPWLPHCTPALDTYGINPAPPAPKKHQNRQHRHCKLAYKMDEIQSRSLGVSLHLNTYYWRNLQLRAPSAVWNRTQTKKMGVGGVFCVNHLLWNEKALAKRTVGNYVLGSMWHRRAQLALFATHDSLGSIVRNFNHCM